MGSTDILPENMGHKYNSITLSPASSSEYINLQILKWSVKLLTGPWYGYYLNSSERVSD